MCRTNYCQWISKTHHCQSRCKTNHCQSICKTNTVNKYERQITVNQCAGQITVNQCAWYPVCQKLKTTLCLYLPLCNISKHSGRVPPLFTFEFKNKFFHCRPKIEKYISLKFKIRCFLSRVGAEVTITKIIFMLRILLLKLWAQQPQQIIA